MTPTTEVGMLILASITLLGTFSMAFLKLCESNGGTCKHKSCCGECEYDLRKSETRVKEMEINSMV